jgi:tRNA A37 methylthiotransferase MiaB
VPEQWRTKQPVLCIPGLGLLDEAAALMVAQLIEREGIGARVEQADALSISRIFSLDTKDVALVCLCYVEDATSAQIRYALRRLRRKAPDAYILVTMMGAAAKIEAREALQGFPNTGVVESLDETVAQVRTAASGQQDRAPPPDANALARAASL